MKKKIEIAGGNMKVTEFLEGGSFFTRENTEEMIKMTMTFENGAVAVQEITPNGVKTSLTPPKPKEDAIKNAEVASYPTENIQADGTFIIYTTDDEGREIKVEHRLGGISYTYI